jgi:hypothetical protein
VVQQWELPVEPPEEARTEWYEVDAHLTYVVTLETALFIERQLDRLPEPHWLEFRDVFGARHRIRAHSVSRFTESTPAARAAIRAFLRARRLEEEAEPDC